MYENYTIYIPHWRQFDFEVNVVMLVVFQQTIMEFKPRTKIPYIYILPG